MSVLPRTNRRRRDHPRPIRTIILGLIVTAVATGICYQLVRLYNGVPTTNYERVFVSVPNIGNLLPHDFVRISGKRVGQVFDVDVGEDGRPRVELQLAPGTRLPADTQVAIRANGLLGARYVQLKPGNDRALLRKGATIKGDASSYTLGLPEAVDTFDQETRGGMRTTFQELGAGALENGAPLNPSLKVFDDGAHKFDRTMESILSRPDAAARLLPSFASGMAALDGTTYAVGSFTGNAIRALQPFISERQAVRDTLAAMPATMAAAESGLRRGRVLLGSVREFSTAAARTLPPAPRAFRDLTALLREARGPLGRTLPVLKILPRGTVGARTVLNRLDPIVKHLQAGLELARPILDEVADHGCDVIDTGVTLRSMTGWAQAGEDYNGPNGPAMAFRLQATVPFAGSVGVTEPVPNLLVKDAYEAPCKYGQQEYPQFVPNALQRRAAR